MVLILYKFDASPPVRAALMTIEVLKIPNVEYVDIDLFKGEHRNEDYLKLNPHHTIPTLKDDDFVITDSHAIGSYLVSTYGKDDFLYPADPKKRAIVDQRLYFDSGILFPPVRDAAGYVIFQGEKSFRDETLKRIESGYELAEKLFTADWIAGDNITLADICCVSSVSSMNEILPIDKDKFRKLWAWLQRCSQQEFYKNKNEPGLKQLREYFNSKLA